MRRTAVRDPGTVGAASEIEEAPKQSENAAKEGERTGGGEGEEEEEGGGERKRESGRRTGPTAREVMPRKSCLWADENCFRFYSRSPPTPGTWALFLNAPNFV